MGVRGLTTFIGANAEVYLKPHELHDTKLVIDGDNLCVQLFKKSQLKSNPLGGNYDVYYRIVVDFFDLLKLANVVPYVLLDGGYEARKMSVIRNRLWQKIQLIKKFCPTSLMGSMPLMIREVFVNAMEACGVAFMRCPFEADDEVAILARKLNCPVLSYDSDFYIHDVQYIPYVTLSHKVYRKVTDKDGDNFKVGIIQRNQPKKGKKRSGGIKLVAQYGDEDVVNGGTVEEYSYLDCCLYTIDNLIGPNDQLGKEMIPLFAVLLGNDYIERNVLSAFHSVIQTGRANRKINRYERHLRVMLKWLQHHTLQSATRAIINHIKREHKEQVYRKILTAMRGYNCENCISLDYFGLEEQVSRETTDDVDIEEDLHNCLDGMGSETTGVPDSKDDNYLPSDEEQDCSEKETDLQSEDGSEDEEEVGSDIDDSIDDEESQGEEDSAEENVMDGHQPLYGLNPGRNKYTDSSWPEWFKELYRAAKVPRFLADLLHSNFYLNYPQIESIQLSDSNSTSYPILRTIFSILKTGCEEHVTEFKYITRKVVRSGVKKVPFQDVHLPEGTTYDRGTLPNVTILQKLFEESGIHEWEDLFKAIKSMPANWRLYFLAIIYWAKNNAYVDLAHVHAVVICVLQLQLIDKSLKNHSRNVKQFRQQNQTFLQQQRNSFDEGVAEKKSKTSSADGFTRTFFNRLTSGTSRAELMLAYDELGEHFSPEEKPGSKKTGLNPWTLHTLASFQAVCFNLSALIPLLGYPIDNLRMHELFNSLFVYNVYGSIRERKDLFEHEASTFFRYSPGLFAGLRGMVELVQKYVPELKNRKRVVKNAVKPSKKDHHSKVGRVEIVPSVNEAKDDSSDTDSEAFVDSNNKFSQLLLSK